MKTHVRESSLNVYHGDVVGAKEFGQAETVERFVRNRTTVTRRQIATGLGMETGTVAARVNKLVADGVLIESGPLSPCPITGKRVHWLQHRDNARGQLSLI